MNFRNYSNKSTNCRLEFDKPEYAQIAWQLWPLNSINCSNRIQIVRTEIFRKTKTANFFDVVVVFFFLHTSRKSCNETRFRVSSLLFCMIKKWRMGVQVATRLFFFAVLFYRWYFYFIFFLFWHLNNLWAHIVMVYIYKMLIDHRNNLLVCFLFRSFWIVTMTQNVCTLNLISIECKPSATQTCACANSSFASLQKKKTRVCQCLSPLH